MEKVDNINDNSLKKFIGKNYDKISTNWFNIFGFLFTNFYMYYRKMYLYGIFVFIIQIMLFIFLRDYYYITFVINLLVGFLINKVYIIYAKRKVNRIKNKNQDKTIVEINEICESKGGTSFISLFIGILLELIIVLIIVVKFLGLSINKEKVEDKTSYVSDYIPGVFSGILYNSYDVVIKDEFELTAPDVFDDYSYEEQFRYQYYTDDGTNFSCCRYSLSLLEDFTSSENLIRDMSGFYKGRGSIDIQNKVSNDINWFWFSYDTDLGKNYYYAMNKGNKVYLLNYVIQGDIDGSCEAHREEVVDLIKIKEKNEEI
ncbi:MAG: DUF2628 domain-containing protein [Bacilli bacterium]|nr:DUF2628 domain-containing protein [Bacilli bacterium]